MTSWRCRSPSSSTRCSDYVEHVDLLLIRRGEKVTVDIQVIITGEAASGTLVLTDANTLSVEVEAMSIPESLTVDIEGAEAGTQFLAGDVTLPAGATLITDPEALVVAVQTAPTAEEVEAETEAGRGRGRRRPRREDRDRRLIVAAETFLVVGLGNPGKQYAGQPAQCRRDGRRRAGAPGRWLLQEPQGRRRHRRDPLADARVVLAKPRSYMNLSGGATAGLARFFSIEPAGVIAVHDELDLPPATIRVKSGGGEGGHNGLRSISASLGTKDYLRVRFGIGRPPGRMDPADYVLRDFSAAERKELERRSGTCRRRRGAADRVGLEATQNQLHAT